MGAFGIVPFGCSYEINLWKTCLVRVIIPWSWEVLLVHDKVEIVTHGLQ